MYITSARVHEVTHAVAALNIRKGACNLCYALYNSPGRDAAFLSLLFQIERPRLEVFRRLTVW